MLCWITACWHKTQQRQTLFYLVPNCISNNREARAVTWLLPGCYHRGTRLENFCCSLALIKGIIFTQIKSIFHKGKNVQASGMCLWRNLELVSWMRLDQSLVFSWDYELHEFEAGLQHWIWKWFSKGSWILEDNLFFL